MTLRFHDWFLNSSQNAVECLDGALESVHRFLVAVLDRLSRTLAK